MERFQIAPAFFYYRWKIEEIVGHFPLPLLGLSIWETFICITTCCLKIFLERLLTWLYFLVCIWMLIIFLGRFLLRLETWGACKVCFAFASAFDFHIETFVSHVSVFGVVVLFNKVLMRLWNGVSQLLLLHMHESWVPLKVQGMILFLVSLVLFAYGSWY